MALGTFPGKAEFYNTTNTKKRKEKRVHTFSKGITILTIRYVMYALLLRNSTRVIAYVIRLYKYNLVNFERK